MHSFYLHKKSMNILITNLQLFCNFFSVSWFPQNNEDTKKTRPSVEAWRQGKEITKFAEITPKCLNNNQLLVYFKYLCVHNMYSLFSLLCFWASRALTPSYIKLFTHWMPSFSQFAISFATLGSLLSKATTVPYKITIKGIAKPARLRKVNTLPANRLWPALSHSLHNWLQRWQSQVCIWISSIHLSV